MEQDVEARLRAALRDALKTRDVVAAFAVRSALGAIGNAEAVPAETGSAASPAAATSAASGYVAQAAAGAGATEAARRQLSPADLRAIVAAEASERETAADSCEQAGHPDRAARLLREARILRDLLEG